MSWGRNAWETEAIELQNCSDSNPGHPSYVFCDPISSSLPTTALLIRINPGIGGVLGGEDPGPFLSQIQMGQGRGQEESQKDSRSVKETRPQTVKDRALRVAGKERKTGTGPTASKELVTRWRPVGPLPPDPGSDGAPQSLRLVEEPPWGARG